uniref:Peroxiredoxin-like 2A n=1 Tax=Strongylocentrotus purpuratus TaxID=7668 RepID=A0A7M7NEU3_STRPU
MALLWGAAAAAVGGLLVANMDFWLPRGGAATTEAYLAGAVLQLLGETKLQAQLSLVDEAVRTFKAKDLWKDTGAVVLAVRRPGCSLCREEAKELSSLKPELDALGIPLYAVLLEPGGYKEFLPFFSGEVFLDTETRFYGEEKRNMSLVGLLRISTLLQVRENKKQGIQGNYIGNGLTLGGIFVIGPGDQGVLLEYRNKDFSDHASNEKVLEAVKNIAPSAPITAKVSPKL